MSSGKKIDLFLNEKYLSHGITKWVPWDMGKAPHILVVGQSGSGKTYACIMILCKVYIFCFCEIFVLDYKGGDFDYLEKCKRYYRCIEVHNGLHDFYNRFLLRQKGEDKNRYPLVLFIDEWSSYINSGEKKVIEEDKKLLGILVSLGRSFSCHVIISQQTGHASSFNQYRDDFSTCIGIGNLSEENRKMLFPDYAKNLLPDRTRGTGYLAFNGMEPIPIVVPKIRNKLMVQNTIRKAVGLP